MLKCINLILLSDERKRSIGTHATCIRALIIVKSPLVILGENHRLHLRTIDKTKERKLRTGEELLHHYPAVTELVIQKHILQCSVSFLESFSYDNTLAGSKTVILQHNRKLSGIDISKSLIVVRKSAVSRGRDIVFGHQGLGEILAGLDTGSSLRRTENLQPAGFELIHDTGSQRNLRAYDSKVNTFILSEFSKLIHLSILERNTLGLTSYTGIARSTKNLLHPG